MSLPFQTHPRFLRGQQGVEDGGTDRKKLLLHRFGKYDLSMLHGHQLRYLITFSYDSVLAVFEITGSFPIDEL